MLKKSKKLGKSISTAGIQGISRQGLWILIDDQEFFLPFDAYPWFLKTTIDQIYDFRRYSKGHLYWKLLDVDIDIDSLKNPAACPSTYK